jgi:hypothetical protein
MECERIGMTGGPGSSERGRSAASRAERGSGALGWSKCVRWLGRPTRGKEGRRGGGDGPGRSAERRREWASVQPTRRGKEEREEEWAGLRELGCLSSILSLFLFFCYTPLIQTILLEFKYNLNSNLYTQHK